MLSFRPSWNGFHSKCSVPDQVGIVFAPNAQFQTQLELVYSKCSVPGQVGIVSTPYAQFLNSAWIEEVNIKPYGEFKEQLIKSSKSGAFKEAVESIEDYIKNGKSDIDDPDATFNKLRESTNEKKEKIPKVKKQFLEKFGGQHPPSKSSIWALSKKLETKGTLLDNHAGGRPKMSEEMI
uniref:Uncharacterized protein n=1 Tax=Timema bartmani TaxID=61472 RepID=A0A7R9HWQ4_9NEOP|nr:unnamed protein product [Timema bartmani]